MGPNAEKQTMVYNVNRTTDVTDYMGKNCTQVMFSDESLIYLMFTMQRKDVKITVVYMNVMNASDLEGWCHGLGAIYHFFKAAFTSLVEPLCSKTDTIEHCETIKGSALTAT